MFEQFLSDDIGCGPFFDHIKRWFFQFGSTMFWSLCFKRALEFQKLNPEKYKVLFFEEAKADLGYFLSMNLTSKLCHKVYIGIYCVAKIKHMIHITGFISYDSYHMVHMISHEHIAWTYNMAHMIWAILPELLRWFNLQNKIQQSKSE